MVVDEYRDMVAGSVSSLRPLLPPDSRLIFEQTINDITKDSGGYVEWYLLIEATARGRSGHRVLRKELMLHVPELEDIPMSQRRRAVENWLNIHPQAMELGLACDYVIPGILYGQIIYVPNRFPEQFVLAGDIVSFVEVLSGTRAAH